MIQAPPQNGSEVARASLPVSGSPAPASPDSGSPALRGSAGSGPLSGVSPGGVAQGQGPGDQQSKIQAEPLRQANQPVLAQRDKELLSALADGDETVLATLQPDELGPWLERPEIQSAIAAAFELREIRLRFKLSAATDRAIDRMTAVFDANKDLADPLQRGETRKAASAIFRVARAFQPVIPRGMGFQPMGAAAPRGDAFSPSSPLGGSGSMRQSRMLTMGAPSTTAPSSHPPTSNGSRSQHDAHRHTASSSALPSSPPAAAEPPPLDISAPQASIAGVLAAFKQLPTGAPRAALKHVERAIALPIRFQPINQERFLSHLAASPALTARNCPFRTHPIKIEGATATQRVTYTLPDGTTAAAIFRTIRRDPAPNAHTPISWPIDSIHPADTS